MKNVIRTAVTAGALAAVLAGCGAPQLVALGQACAAEQDGADIAVEGFVAVDSSVFCSGYGGDYRCGVEIDETPDGGATAGLDILAGGGSNTMDEPASGFTEADLRIRADDGSPVAVGDRVRASGAVSVAPGVCFVTVDKIERI